MSAPSNLSPSRLSQVEDQLSAQHGPNSGFNKSPGWLFKGQVLNFQPQDSESDSLPQRLRLASNIARFAGALVVGDIEDKRITHIVVDNDGENGRSLAYISGLRNLLSNRAGANKKIPRLVTVGWIEHSWEERTLLDEESTFYPSVIHAHLPYSVFRYVPPGLVLYFRLVDLLYRAAREFYQETVSLIDLIGFIPLSKAGELNA